MLIGWPEGVTTLAVLLTLFFIAWQAILMRQTVTASEEASKRELRAYLTVVIGDATYQERRDPDKGGDLMFECRPMLLNTGRTPARKITFKAGAAVMASPLPKEVHLPDSPDEGVGDSIMGPQQNAFMSAVVDGFRPDNEVLGIKQGIGNKALYVWGRVTYQDVFGETHFTQFCQQCPRSLHSGQKRRRLEANGETLRCRTHAGMACAYGCGQRAEQQARLV
jgi:hypothetical protein